MDQTPDMKERLRRLKDKHKSRLLGLFIEEIKTRYRYRYRVIYPTLCEDQESSYYMHKLDWAFAEAATRLITTTFLDVKIYPVVEYVTDNKQGLSRTLKTGIKYSIDMKSPLDNDPDKIIDSVDDWNGFIESIICKLKQSISRVNNSIILEIIPGVRLNKKTMWSIINKMIGDNDHMNRIKNEIDERLRVGAEYAIQNGVLEESVKTFKKYEIDKFSRQLVSLLQTKAPPFITEEDILISFREMIVKEIVDS